MPEGSDFRRMPALEKTVSEMTPQDMRVRVIGTVLDRKEERLVLDDGTGKIDVSFEKPPEVGNQKLVRVFGRVISMEGGLELQGEVIQELDGFDLDLWKKVRELEKVQA
jgi:hypothetical protein